MEHTLVRSRFLALSDAESNSDTEILVYLGEAKVTSLLRDPELDNDENMLYLTNAAAGIAYYFYALQKSASFPSGEFSANGVSAKINAAEYLDHAKRLRDEYLAAAAHLLVSQGDSFAFIETEG